MSPSAEAFESILDAQEAFAGKREKCTLNGLAVDFLIGDTNLIELPVEGGLAQSGSYVGLVRVADFEKSQAEKFSPFEFRGQTLQVLNLQRINATVQITAGDPMEDQQ